MKAALQCTALFQCKAECTLNLAITRSAKTIELIANLVAHCDGHLEFKVRINSIIYNLKLYGLLDLKYAGLALTTQFITDFVNITPNLWFWAKSILNPIWQWVGQ